VSIPLPAKNPMDYDDIRGEWCSIELEAESRKQTSQNIFIDKLFENLQINAMLNSNYNQREEDPSRIKKKF
jgi:hypothetical protein